MCLKLFLGVRSTPSSKMSCPCVLSPVFLFLDRLHVEVQVRVPDGFAEEVHFANLITETSNQLHTHCLISPPHATFNTALRGESTLDIYGWSQLSSDVKSRVKKETLLAIRVSKIAQVRMLKGIPGSSRTPSVAEHRQSAMFLKLQVSWLTLHHDGIRCKTVGTTILFRKKGFSRIICPMRQTILNLEIYFSSVQSDRVCEFEDWHEHPTAQPHRVEHRQTRRFPKRNPVACQRASLPSRSSGPEENSVVNSPTAPSCVTWQRARGIGLMTTCGTSRKCYHVKWTGC